MVEIWLQSSSTTDSHHDLFVLSTDDFDFEGEPPLFGNPVSVIEVVPCTIFNFFDAGAVISDLEVAVMGVGFVRFESDGLGLVFRLYSFELFCELVLLLLHVLFEVSGFFLFFVDDL